MTPHTIDVACAIIHNEYQQVLVAQRSAIMSLPLKWEFPGGKVELGESPKDCLVREIKEELDIQIIGLKELPPCQYIYPTIAINLLPFTCVYAFGEIILREHNTFKWLNKNDLLDLDWADADIAVVNYYLNHFHGI